MSTRFAGIPDYRNLDQTSESRAAAERMEARSREPASTTMFEALVLPLLREKPKRIVELGCGSGALARRIARELPGSDVLATDKSEGMLAFAQAGDASERLANLRYVHLDATGFDAFAARVGPFDLIVSSVTVPYLSDEETETLVARCAKALTPRGRLMFLEQDLLTDALQFPEHDLLRRVFAKDARTLKRTLALGLRPLLRDAGLEVEPRESFLWSDEGYGPYARELLGKMADDALAAGRITSDERERWTRELERLHGAGDFYYGLVYHRILGTRREAR